MPPALPQNIDRRLRFARRGLGWGAFTGATWGLDGVLLGIALAAGPFTHSASLIIGPLVVAALHDGFAAVWLFIYNCGAGKWRELVRTLRVKPGRIICLAALMGGPIGMAGYLLGIAHAGAAYAMAVSAMYPAVGSLLAVIFLRERISPRAWFGIALCVAGSIVVGYTPPDIAQFPHFKLGLGLALLAALGWGSESVLSTYGMDLVDPDIAINIREAVSCATYMVVILPAIGGYHLLRGVLTDGPVALIALAGVCGGTSYLAWYKSLNMTGVGRAMALSITYVLWGILYGMLLTHLRVTPTLIAGTALIFVGALLIVANPSELLTLRRTDPPAEVAP